MCRCHAVALGVHPKRRLTRAGSGYRPGRHGSYRSERPVPPDERSALHICFTAPSRQSVDALHAAGIAGGGRDNGRPGLRSDYGPGYYAAFLSDLDGYRIEAYFDEQGKCSIAKTASPQTARMGVKPG